MTLVHWSSEPANNAVTTDVCITAVMSDETGTSSLLSVYLQSSQVTTAAKYLLYCH